MIRGWFNFLRRRRLLLLGAEGLQAPRLLGAAIDCRRGRTPSGSGSVLIGRGAWIEQGAVLHAFGGRIRLGHDVFVGPYAVVYGHGNVEIGDATLISMHCRILSSNHAVPPAGTEIRSQPDILLPTRLGRDVWLGAGVTVLGGVTIGDGCIVGAGSVVTGDLPPGAVAYGIPATVRRFRDAPGGATP